MPEHVVLLFSGNTGNFSGDKICGGTLTIEGDACGWVGDSMTNGKILIKGSAGVSVGTHMSGGTITIEKDVGAFAGEIMNGGTLIIKGCAGVETGKGMKDGTIDIAGEVTSFHPSIFLRKNKGTVIWKGVTIFKDGKKTPEFEKMNVPVAT